MRRTMLILFTVLTALAIAPVATANKPTREILPLGNDFVVLPTDGGCAFPVLFHDEGKGAIVTTFTDRAGNPVRQIQTFPQDTETLTNLDTGKSITVVTTGPIFFQFEPDGSASLIFTGHTPFIVNPITGEPGIWYSSGQLVATFDPDGNLTSLDFTGNFVNLCDQLSS